VRVLATAPVAQKHKPVGLAPVLVGLRAAEQVAVDDRALEVGVHVPARRNSHQCVARPEAAVADLQQQPPVERRQREPERLLGATEVLLGGHGAQVARPLHAVTDLRDELIVGQVHRRTLARSGRRGQRRVAGDVKGRSDHSRRRRTAVGRVPRLHPGGGGIQGVPAEAPVRAVGGPVRGRPDAVRRGRGAVLGCGAPVRRYPGAVLGCRGAVRRYRDAVPGCAATVRGCPVAVAGGSCDGGAFSVARARQCPDHGP
jgi:hypothetical protein